MKPLDLMTTIQIEITNHCNLHCCACTRAAGLQRHKYFMTLDQFETALISMEGFKGKVGIMGGEPTLHPDFLDILQIYRDYIPLERRGLWTNMAKWKEYEGTILSTFLQDRDHMLKNDHTGEGNLHHPMLMAIKDMVQDPVMRWRLIENCPYQNRWSASINPKGAFFCEVAAASDILFDGPGGWDIEPGWWKKRHGFEFKDQADRYCEMCGGALPVAGVDPHQDYELITPSIKEKFEEIGITLDYELIDREITSQEIEAVYRGEFRPLKHRKEE